MKRSHQTDKHHLEKQRWIGKEQLSRKEKIDSLKTFQTGLINTKPNLKEVPLFETETALKIRQYLIATSSNPQTHSIDLPMAIYTQEKNLLKKYIMKCKKVRKKLNLLFNHII